MKLADALAKKKGTREPLLRDNKLTFKEIETVAKTKLSKTWRILPKHGWCIFGAVATQTFRSINRHAKAYPLLHYLGHLTKRKDAFSMHQAAIVWPLAPAFMVWLHGVDQSNPHASPRVHGKVADRALPLGFDLTRPTLQYVPIVDTVEVSSFQILLMVSAGDESLLLSYLHSIILGYQAFRAF
ncbi:hypothetical protein LAZ67_7000276 [Cordylochernes scorpioides]|uniref:Uncharacterized protein n=1 Tax=Cordylochernes scorpioides TaxID=51811 RepID=A0ABY6KMX8_9ARAC|nr:hypothetical protein LAZ67_7000276 [Cordylochernes scorpioides]